MDAISRRSFVSKAGIGVVAAGAIAATAPFAGRADAAEAHIDSISEPVVAYLTDLRSGTVRLFQGESEVTVVDHTLAQSLARGIAR